MTNCTCNVYATTAMLSAGQRTGDQRTLLYSGPAYLAAPRRSWEKAAALEGILAGSLHIHTRADLSSARLIEIENNLQAGTWDVTATGVGSAGTQWTIPLERRKFASKPAGSGYGSASYQGGDYEP